MIGAGGMLLGLEAPMMKKTKAVLEAVFQKITKDILEPEPAAVENILIPSTIPHRMYYFFGNRGWFSSARKNNLKRKDLYRKPYLIKKKA
jgi:hypothetical protein